MCEPSNLARRSITISSKPGSAIALSFAPKARTKKASTPACRVGENSWRPLREWPPFAGLFEKDENPYAIGRVVPGGVSGRWLWNDDVPLQFNLIVVYCLIVQPILFALFLIAGVAAGGFSAQSQADFEILFSTVFYRCLIEL